MKYNIYTLVLVYKYWATLPSSKPVKNFFFKMLFQLPRPWPRNPTRLDPVPDPCLDLEEESQRKHKSAA